MTDKMTDKPISAEELRAMALNLEGDNEHQPTWDQCVTAHRQAAAEIERLQRELTETQGQCNSFIVNTAFVEDRARRMERERDEALAKLADEERRHKECVIASTENAKVLIGERDEARADCAALRSGLEHAHRSVSLGIDMRCDIGDGEYCDHCATLGAIEIALSQPSPGATLLAEIADLQRELDEARAAADNWQQRFGEACRFADEARADCAALRKAIQDWIDVPAYVKRAEGDWAMVYRCKQILSQPNPGAALLEEVRLLREVEVQALDLWARESTGLGGKLDRIAALNRVRDRLAKLKEHRRE